MARVSSAGSRAGQGLQGSPLIAMVAEKAGVSPEVAQQLMATVLPMVMSHFTQGGAQAPPSGGLMSMAGVLVSRLFLV